MSDLCTMHVLMLHFKIDQIMYPLSSEQFKSAVRHVYLSTCLPGLTPSLPRVLNGERRRMRSGGCLDPVTGATTFHPSYHGNQG